MKKIGVITLFVLGGTLGLYAGGIEERDGQAYMAGVFITVYVQVFATEGTFKTSALELGPEDSEDGTFKNGTWYWAGLGLLKASGILRNGDTIQFKAAPEEEYVWLTARYSGEQITVSDKAASMLWGSLSFNKEETYHRIAVYRPS